MPKNGETRNFTPIYNIGWVQVAYNSMQGCPYMGAGSIPCAGRYHDRKVLGHRTTALANIVQGR